MATPVLARMKSITKYCQPGSQMHMRNTSSSNPPYVMVTVVEADLDAAGTVLIKEEAGTQARVAVADLFPVNLDQQPDCSLLFHISEATLLANLLKRDAISLPYTTTGNVLTSINPCKPVENLYSISTMRQYVGRRPAACPPHLYAVAEGAYRNLSRGDGNQAIVVSGVSGAGKTEANKHIMQYLCWRAGQDASPRRASLSRKISSELLDVQLSELSRCVLQSSVVFEAFCNACTTNNHNSSRFGRFTRLLIEPNGPVGGAVIDAYLLEKSRLVAQNPGERSFHVLYQLLADAPLCAELGLLGAPPKEAPPEHALLALLSPRAQLADAEKRAGASQRPLMPSLPSSRSSRLVPASVAASTGLTPVAAHHQAEEEGLRFDDPSHAALGFEYLRHTGRATIAGMDDAEEWAATLAALEALGVGADERRQIAELLAGLLRLGNVSFRPSATQDADHSEACELAGDGARASLGEVVRLWALNPLGAHGALVSRTMTSRRGSTYTIPLTPSAAAFGRDGMAKAVYERLFRWLLAVQNERLAPAPATTGGAGGAGGAASGAASGAAWIGLLDAFGFELLETNSFEQLLINATNEQLQQLFLQRVLLAEQALYEQEGIALQTKLEFRDNAPTLRVLLGRPDGLLAVLDEECRLPNGSDAGAARKCAEALQAAGHEQSHVTTAGLVQKVAYDVGARQEATRAKIKKLFSSGSPHFTVAHFAGEVVYEAAGWLDKNNDEVHRDLRVLLGDTDHNLLAMLFEPVEGGHAREPGTVRTPTISQVFARDLGELMAELKSSHLHFVRCIKPNDALLAGAPDAGLVLDQLRFSGMLEAVHLISSGYPGRIPFVEIHERFQGKLPAEIMRMSPGDFVRAVVDAVGIAPGEYQIGRSRLFFRTGGADFLRDLQYADGDEVLGLIERPLLEWWARAKIGGGVLGWRGRRQARGVRVEVLERRRQQAELRRACEAALREAMAPPMAQLDLPALKTALAAARAAGCGASLLQEAAALVETVETARAEAGAALRAAIADKPGGDARLAALRTAVPRAKEVGAATALVAEGDAALAAEEARAAREAAERAAKAKAEEERRQKMAAEERARLEAAERAAATRISAAARRRRHRARYGAMRAAAVALQAAARMYNVAVLVRELMLDVRLVRNGHIFIKFSSSNGRPHDRLIVVSDAFVLKWHDPSGNVDVAGDGDVGLPLHEAGVSGALNFGLLKKIIDALQGFDGKTSGIRGPFALRTKCCFSVSGAKRSLDVQAQSEALKAEWVSALKLVIFFRKELRKRANTALGSHKERMALSEALDGRRLVREAQALRKARKGGARGGGIFASFRPGKR